MVNLAAKEFSRPPWVLIAGGFHRRGAMDKANAALARYLIDRDTPVHLVSHAIDPELAVHPDVTVHLARKPAGSTLLGESHLDREGRAVAATIRGASPDARVLVNGGNCDWPDINWVHCVHHAWNPCDRNAPAWFRAKNRIFMTLARRRELRALAHARVILANSNRTRRDLLNCFAIDPDRVHTIYLGSDPNRTLPIQADRAIARAWLHKDASRPLIAFVGALGHDDNKGFDTLWAAWSILCTRPDWDADLIVAGGGLGSEDWRTRVARSPFASRVTLLGFTDRVNEVLNAADLLVSPVRYEAYGLNVHEAISRGVPAMVSACAGIAERYPTELRDLLIPNPEDPGDLALRLLTWRPNLDRWKQRVLPFAQELRKRTWSDMAAQIVSVVQSSGHAV